MTSPSDTGGQRVPDGVSAGNTTASRPPIYRDFILIQLAVLVFFLDQFSKYLVREFLLLYHSFPADGFLRVTRTFNTGSIFGIFQGQNTAFILVSFVGVAVLILIYRSQRFPTALLRLSLGLQLGGAFGNLLDRVRLGHVTDWVDVGPWPVFNLADASIVCGLILLAWLFANRDMLLQRLDQLSTQLESWRERLAAEDAKPLEESLDGLVEGRAKWERDAKLRDWDRLTEPTSRADYGGSMRQMFFGNLFSGRAGRRDPGRRDKDTPTKR